MPLADAPVDYTATVYLTAHETEMRLSHAGSLAFEPFAQARESEPFIFLDPGIEFQELIGIGAALTDAAAETFAKLPPEAQARFLEAHFSRENGIGYTFARTPIGSSDFSSAVFDYVEKDDIELESFSVEVDEQYRLPFIRRCIEAAGGKLTLYASPWSPPGWMKDNGSRLQGGKLLPRYRESWARHYVKFIEAYERHGVPVWGLTVQNEPMATQTWDSCIYTAEEERDFIRDHLGPALESAGLQDRKLIAWDHNRDLIFHRASVILGDPEAARYVWGIGFHWYEGWAGGGMQFGNVTLVARAFPEVALVFTEGTADSFSPDRYDNWEMGEKYAHSMVHDFNCGVVAWTDWNILLDENGGPNHVGNFCFAPVHGDTRTGELRFTNSYYYIGHFSKFIEPGARRIAASSNREALETTAFRNPDGTLVVVVLNRTSESRDFNLWIGVSAAETTLPARSIATYLIGETAHADTHP